METRSYTDKCEDIFVDINTHPVKTLKCNPNETITLGDLHGNALKLLFFLIYEGILTLKNKRDYRIFESIYYKSAADVTVKDINNIQEIIKQASIIDAHAAPAMINFIGDTLADRGSNDLFTLIIIDKLHENKISFQIMLSNHDMEAIRVLESEDPLNTPTTLRSDQCSSIYNLQKIMSRGLVNLSTVLSSYENFKKHLVPLAYLLDDATDTIFYFVHGTVGDETIEAIAAELQKSHKDVIYLDQTKEGLAYTIEKINQAYRKNQNAFHKLILNDLEKFNGPHIPLIYPFARLTWNRDYFATDLKARINHFFRKIIHGHSGHGEVPDQYKAIFINLDNFLGYVFSPPNDQFAETFKKSLASTYPHLYRYDGYVYLEKYTVLRCVGKTLQAVQIKEFDETAVALKKEAEDKKKQQAELEKKQRVDTIQPMHFNMIREKSLNYIKSRSYTSFLNIPFRNKDLSILKTLLMEAFYEKITGKYRSQAFSYVDAIKALNYALDRLSEQNPKYLAVHSSSLQGIKEVFKRILDTWDVNTKHWQNQNHQVQIHELERAISDVLQQKQHQSVDEKGKSYFPGCSSGLLHLANEIEEILLSEELLVKKTYFRGVTHA